jgi:DNA polymerase IIIc chi subunit
MSQDQDRMEKELAGIKYIAEILKKAEAQSATEEDEQAKTIDEGFWQVSPETLVTPWQAKLDALTPARPDDELTAGDQKNDKANSLVKKPSI